MIKRETKNFVDLVLYRRRILVVLGYACNHHCRYCIQGHEKPHSATKYVSERTINLLRLVGQIAGQGKINVTLFGGEPLLYEKALRKLIPEADHPRLNWKMHTNGELLTPEYVDFLNEYKVLVSVSHDGPNVLQTRCSDVFQNSETRALFRKLKRSRIDVLITSYAQNLIEVRKYLCEQLETEDWLMTPAFLVDPGKVPADLLDFNFEAWDETMCEVSCNALKQFERGDTSARAWERKWFEACMYDWRYTAAESPYVRFNERCLVPHLDLAGNLSCCEQLAGNLKRMSVEKGKPWLTLTGPEVAQAVEHRHWHCKKCDAYMWCRGRCPLENVQETVQMCRLTRIFAFHMEKLRRVLFERGLYKIPGAFQQHYFTGVSRSPVIPIRPFEVR